MILSEKDIECLIKDIKAGWLPDESMIKDLIISHELLRQKLKALQDAGH